MDVVNTARNLLKEKLPEVWAVYLFGSFATAMPQKESDLDLAVLPICPLTPIQRWDIQEAIARAVSRNVDLIDLLSASTVFRLQIIQGQRIYCRDEQYCGAFEGLVCSAYVRFNETRQDILDDIQARGRVL